MLFQEKQKSSQIKIHKSFEKQFIEITLILRAEPYFNYIFNEDIIRGSNIDLTFTPMIGIKLGIKFILKK